MAEVVSFLVSNYVWILVIVIITLLAIIGGYANKTNFGEGEKKEKAKNNEDINSNIQNITLNDAIGIKQETQNKQDNNIDNVETQENINAVNSPTKNVETSNNIKNENIFKSIEDKLSSLDNELNSILQKKDVINDNILEDIDDMSFSNEKKSEKKVFNDIKTSDIELPEIKSLKDKDEDIWNIKKQ